MDLEAALGRDAFSMSPPEKRAFLLGELNALTRSHRRGCAEYGRILSVIARDADRDAERLADVPYLPVSLFKERDLVSVPREQVFRTLASSGTTGAARSRVHLDRETATLQARALLRILASALGPRRLPMVVIDSRSVLDDRASLTARSAAILGMLPVGRDPFFALDASGRLDADGLRAHLRRHAGTPILVFGFTFLVWQHLGPRSAAAGMGLDLSDAVLLHGGGWKRLREIAVDDPTLRAGLAATTGLRRVHNYYGMAEQAGSVFLQCERGHLHAPGFADVVVRDPATLQEAADGDEGILHVLSALPRSYPGHSLLTEDLGRVLGRARCACGREGTRFAVEGRIPRVELRGCSDVPAPGVPA